MKYVMPLVTLAVLLGGCAHSRPFDPAAPEGRAEVNAQVGGRSTVVVLTSGERAEAESLRLAPDGASWIEPETGEARSVALAEVRAVQVPARSRGALEGFVIGVVIGAGLGILSLIDDSYFSSRPLTWIGATTALGVRLALLLVWSQGGRCTCPSRCSWAPLP